MSSFFLLSFRSNVSLLEESAKEVFVSSPLVTLKFFNLTPGLLTAIKTLAANGATEEDFSDIVRKIDGDFALPKFYNYLKKFNDWSMISHTLLEERNPIATIVPISRYYQFHLKEVKPEQKYVLSRFAYCRKYQEQLVLESPLSYAQIVLKYWSTTTIINELVKPQNYLELEQKISGISEDTIKLFLGLLISTEFISEADEDGKIHEEDNVTLLQWSFHDLLFHARSRLGRHINYYRKSTPLLSEAKPHSVVKPKMSNDTIDLYKPDIEKLKETDFPFTLVQEKRKSIRSYAAKPITDKQLSEFLYRCARVKNIIQTDYGEISSRPYPNAAADYELELYITINNCENILPGLYHYCPREHQLCKLSDNNNYVEALLQKASEAVRQSKESLQVLITIAARFPKRSWQYEANAYALTLKHVGILTQTMYLVATAMDLAPCAIAYGDADLFAAAVGTDYYAETSVGEFILGSKQSD
ncbi:SagB family peptide dehydrogenase [uncultured Nostoc sp.]|uniref:SagB family peptide dehydrogenase n=1 Tax=uncultured Nostoc sp. TaxID=340711 RepID=UPI0035CB1237